MLAALDNGRVKFFAMVKILNENEFFQARSLREGVPKCRFHVIANAFKIRYDRLNFHEIADFLLARKMQIGC